jgi:hypothetical protein
MVFLAVLTGGVDLSAVAKMGIPNLATVARVAKNGKYRCYLAAPYLAILVGCRRSETYTKIGLTRFSVPLRIKPRFLRRYVQASCDDGPVWRRAG